MWIFTVKLLASRANFIARVAIPIKDLRNNVFLLFEVSFQIDVSGGGGGRGVVDAGARKGR